METLSFNGFKFLTLDLSQQLKRGQNEHEFSESSRMFFIRVNSIDSCSFKSARETEIIALQMLILHAVGLQILQIRPNVESNNRIANTVFNPRLIAAIETARGKSFYWSK